MDGAPEGAAGGAPAADSDLELLRAHSAGDPDAFGELVRRHRDRLWAVALRTLGDREEAADALQDAFISAFRATAGFRGDSAVTTWLHRIVVNACLDRVRRRVSRPAVPLPEAGPDEPVEPRDAMAERDLALTIDEALAQLPIEQRSAIVLVDVHGYSVADTAVILDIAEGTVKSRCARGRGRLAVLLAGLRNPGPDNGVETSVRPPRSRAAPPTSGEGQV